MTDQDEAKLKAEFGDPHENERVTGALPEDGEQDVSQDASIEYTDGGDDEQA